MPLSGINYVDGLLRLQSFPQIPLTLILAIYCQLLLFSLSPSLLKTSHSLEEILCKLTAVCKYRLYFRSSAYRYGVGFYAFEFCSFLFSTQLKNNNRQRAKVLQNTSLTVAWHQFSYFCKKTFRRVFII